MCGIVGLIDAVAGRVPLPLLEAMRDSMAYRGPDGEGHFIEGPIGLAMRRLSIIDLQGGKQPLASRDGRVLAFQNGEIYNHLDLRRRLEARGHRFLTHSDTEVLAHGYAEWGIDGLLDSVDGMFAVAILDRERRVLHLARDRYGEKPLFVLETPGRFAYSSTMLSLAALPWASDRWDARSLRRYLALHYVPGDSTLLESIGRVLPGERLVVGLDDAKARRVRYYRPSLGRSSSREGPALADLIEKAVDSRMVADVPVGVFLSGGLDSSIIAAAAARRHPKVSTFSMGFSSKAHDEAPFAELVARAIGSDHHHFVFDESAFLKLLPEVAGALDEPLGDQALLPLYWLSREARRHVTVVLSGEGADEIFAGYGYYRPFAAPARRKWWELFRGAAAPAAEGPGRFIDNRAPVTPSGFPLLTDVGERDRLVPDAGRAADAWESEMLGWLSTAGNPLERASAADLATWLPDDLLVKADRMTMAHSLEGRAPYLHPEIVAAGLGLPAERRMEGASDKVALREVARRWIPASIRRRPKQGFVLPMKRWLGEWFSARGGPSAYLRERPLPLIQASELLGLVERDVARGIQRERLLFAVLMLAEWYHAFRAQVDALRTRYAAPAAGAASPTPAALKPSKG